MRILEIGGPMSQYHAGVVLLALGLLYLLVRMLMVGFRAPRPAGRLVPLVPMTWLLVALIGLTCFRIAYVKVDQTGVVDVGRVSAEGARQIAEGKGLYDEPLSRGDPQGNTYGPSIYLFYVPFERAAKWIGREAPETPAFAEVRRDHYWAARAAAVSFDLLTMLGLFLLGGRLHPGNGRALGLVLAFAWASCPYTLYALKHGSNDGLVALLLVAALLALGSPPLRGAITALAAATKFAPGAVVPLFATAADERRGRSALVFTGSFILVSAAIFLPVIPDGGIREIYDRTVGFQAAREVGSTVWLAVPRAADGAARGTCRGGRTVAAACVRARAAGAVAGCRARRCRDRRLRVDGHLLVAVVRAVVRAARLRGPVRGIRPRPAVRPSRAPVDGQRQAPYRRRRRQSRLRRRVARALAAIAARSRRPRHGRSRSPAFPRRPARPPP